MARASAACGKTWLRTGVAVSYITRVGELFAALEQTGSLEAALSDAVRLACEATRCSAGAVVTELDATRAADAWLRHDPRGLLEGLISTDATLGASPNARHGQSGVTSCATGLWRPVQIPLRCGARNVGWLILLAPRELSEEQLKGRIAGIDAALAVLMMAVECSAAMQLSGVLSRQAFWARVASEISRSQRGDDEFSVLHVRITGMEVCAGEELTSRWTRIARLGEALAARLRTSDVVGLTGADRLAVLFTATGRLGARIATRRIEQLLQVPENESDGLLDHNGGVPELCLRTFPHDAADIDSLRRVQRWRSEMTGLALPATRPG